MMRTLLLGAALLALGACGLPTLYGPAADGYGYSSTQLESDRFRVSFRGNSLTERETVENYLLYRAAELTLAQGGDYFVLVERSTEPQTHYNTGPSTFGGFGYGGWGPHYHRSAFLGSGTATPITNYRADADIVIRSGPKPPNEPRAYDAREVMARLGPSIVRPPTDR